VNSKTAYITLLYGLALSQQFAAAANIADFTDYSLLNASGQVVLPGRLFIPPQATTHPHLPRPFMVFLHGGGAIGTDNITQVQHTPDYLLDEARRRGAYLYVPQAPTRPTGWANLSSIDAAMTMIDRAILERNVNVNRLYVTGYSNGGGGTWNLLSRNPGRFAAAFTLSSIAPAAGFNPGNLLDTPIVTVHARDDATVPVARTRNVINGILTAANEPLPSYLPAGSGLIHLVSNPEYSFHHELAAAVTPDIGINHFISRPDLDLMYLESPDGGHTGLLGLYYSPTIYDWMFDHALNVPEPGTMTILLGLAFAASAARRRAHSS
jgi:predicted esterase